MLDNLLSFLGIECSIHEERKQTVVSDGGWSSLREVESETVTEVMPSVVTQEVIHLLGQLVLHGINHQVGDWPEDEVIEHVDDDSVESSQNKSG